MNDGKAKSKSSSPSPRVYRSRYVTFTSAGIRVDIDRYLESKAGKSALNRIDSAGKKLKKAAG